MPVGNHVRHETQEIELFIMVAFSPDSREEGIKGSILDRQLSAFMELNPGIKVTRVPVASYDTFYTEVLRRLDAGHPLDIGGALYNHGARCAQKGVLEAVDAFMSEEDTFLPGALRSGFFGTDTPYGVPWQRLYNSANYRYLIQFRGSRHREQVLALMRFLTHPDQQLDYYHEVPYLFPTRQEAYKEDVGLSKYAVIQDTRVVRLTPEQVEYVIERAQRTSAGVKVNPWKATGIPGSVQATVPPVIAGPDPDQFETELDNNGVVVGTILVDQQLSPLQIADYTATWRRDSDPTLNTEVMCELTAPGVQSVTLPLVELQVLTDIPPGPPDVTVSQGSFRICWTIGGRRGCIEI